MKAASLEVRCVCITFSARKSPDQSGLPAVADPVLTDILVPTKAAIAAIGPNMAKIILAALVVLLILAVLVATGHINQKGPHGRRGPSGPRS